MSRTTITGAIVLALAALHLNVARAEEELKADPQQEAFAREAMQRQLGYEKKFEELGKKFQALDLASVLQPVNIVSKKGVEKSKVTLATYRKLLAERKGLVETVVSETERFVSTKAPSVEQKVQGLAALHASRDATIKKYADLDRSQLAMADALEAVVAWAESQKGKLVSRDGKLVYALESQKEEFMALLQRVRETHLAQLQAAEKVRPQAGAAAPPAGG